MMTDFEYDAWQKKIVARGARHRKVGSKSKICSLSTDYMSHKQWAAKNGAIITYNLNKPMKWEEFKSIPSDAQKEYLSKLISEYHATSTSIRDMFGISAPTFRKYITDHEIPVSFSCGSRMDDAEKERWIKFCSGEETGEDTEETCQDFGQETSEDIFDDKFDSQTMTDGSSERIGMIMKHFMLCFDGRLDPDMIANSLRSILGKGTFGRIDISCDLEG